ncbi:uncharacterized protein LOC135814438 [Sycon ciliatum]|uniref:uncharacterized protein LOC135814438 n=1 Tax=Sycon ciliatum TaxID=27933 RepID=UPI0031F65C0D
MSDRIRLNIAYLANNLSTSILLEELLEDEVLTLDEYRKVLEEKSKGELEVRKQLVRCMLEKSESDVAAFLATVGKHQPFIVEHVEDTIRRKTTGPGRAASVDTDTGSPPHKKTDETQAASTTAAFSKHDKPVHSSDTQPPSKQAEFSLPELDQHFTGRNEIVGEVCDNILGPAGTPESSVQVHNLVGPPGFGKTSVAIAVASGCQDKGMQVMFVDLRGVTSPSLAQALLDRALGDTYTNGRGSYGAVPGVLQSKQKDVRTLVVLDNAEDCIKSATEQEFQLQDVVNQIITRSRTVSVLLTSRVHLELHAAKFKLEQYSIGCLEVKPAQDLLMSLTLPRSRTAREAAELVRHCGYVPLAIRITASAMLGGRRNAKMMLKLLVKIGVDVFDDEKLKPNERITRLLKIAHDDLSKEEQESFHALSHFPAKFSPDAAGAMIKLRRSNKTAVHHYWFDPLIRICFLEYCPETERYSMQPFIAEFGRKMSTEDESRTYIQRLCHINMDCWQRAVCAEAAKDEETDPGQVLMYCLIDQPNFAYTLECIADGAILADELVEQYANLLSSQIMCSYLWKKSGPSVLAMCLTATSFKLLPPHTQLSLLFNYIAFLPVDGSAAHQLNINSVMAAAQHLVDTCEKDLSSISILEYHLCNVAVSLRRTVVEQTGEAARSFEGAAHVAYVYASKMMDSSSSPATETTAAQLTMQLANCVALDKAPDMLELECIAKQIGLSSSSQWYEWTDNCGMIEIFTFAMRALLIRASSTEDSSMSVSPVLLGAIAAQRHMLSALLYGQFDEVTDFTCLHIYSLVHALGHIVFSKFEKPSELFLNLLIINLNFQWKGGLTTPASYLASPLSPYKTIDNYMSWFLQHNQSGLELSSMGKPSVDIGNDEDLGHCMSCLWLTERYSQDLAMLSDTIWSKYVTIPNTTEPLVDSGLKLLRQECLERLPKHFQYGISVTTAVCALRPGTTRRGCNLNLLAIALVALHHQSKRGQVSIDHHIALREWCECVAACFVCYDLDNITACPRCGMSYLCAKHCQAEKYWREHGQYCDMLSDLRTKLSEWQEAARLSSED